MEKWIIQDARLPDGSFRTRDCQADHSGLPAAFCFVCQIFYYRPGQRCLYPFRHTRGKYPYNTECIILSIPKRARVKCSGYFWKSSVKRVYPYPLVTLWKRCAILKRGRCQWEHLKEGKEYVIFLLRRKYDRRSKST